MLKEVLTAFIAGCLVSLVTRWIRSDLWRYLLSVAQRIWDKHPHPLYECVGGIVVPAADPTKQHIDMDDVPSLLYEKALGLARIQVAQGVPPRFDLKVRGERDLYLILAGLAGGVHVLAFYRRPRFLTTSP